MIVLRYTPTWSLLLVEQVGPFKPSGQTHTGVVATIEQLPPFWQGLISHSAMRGTSQILPVYPGKQTQVKLSSPSTPLMQTWFRGSNSTNNFMVTSMMAIILIELQTKDCKASHSSILNVKTA